jgi:DinB family protein
MTLATGQVLQLQPELIQLKQELLDGRERARKVAEGLVADQWGARPVAGGWSVAECLMHLNITSERYIPIIDEAVRTLRSRGLTPSGPLRRDFVGWLLSTMFEPPVRVKMKTPATFAPARVDPMPEVLERFDYLQGELLQRLDRANGLALDRQKVTSPFNAHVKYNVYSTFRIIAAHQRRHLWQAEQVSAALGG